jgi:tetratricopeptide (TPR) repeat protein
MKLEEAMRAVQDYYELANPGEDDNFRLVEALEFLIAETKEPKYMCELGWHYCRQKRFDLEVKYMEMAAESGYGPALEELGYVWYYGQNGEVDYAKAYEYYSKGAEADGSLWCKLKIADMYKNGYYVRKNKRRYRKLIEEAYEEVRMRYGIGEPYPQIAFRLAGIRAEDGKTEEAAWLLKMAKKSLAERLSVDFFWGHVEEMEEIVRTLYGLAPLDESKLDFYDLFVVTDTPGRVTFKRRRKTYEMDFSGDDCAIHFQGKWYRNFRDLCEKAEVNGKKIVCICDEFEEFEVYGQEDC